MGLTNHRDVGIGNRREDSRVSIHGLSMLRDVQESQIANCISKVKISPLLRGSVSIL